MQNAIIDRIEKAQEKKRPRVNPGDRVSVHVRLKEGGKERIQIFKGVVISRSPKSGHGPNATFTVRKISEGVGVERIFPLHSPSIDKLKVEASSDVRRSRLFYLRELRGKKARLKEKQGFEDLIVPEPQEEEVIQAEAAGEEGAAEAEAATPEATEAKKSEEPQKSN